MCGGSCDRESGLRVWDCRPSRGPGTGALVRRWSGDRGDPEGLTPMLLLALQCFLLDPWRYCAARIPASPSPGAGTGAGRRKRELRSGSVVGVIPASRNHLLLEGRPTVLSLG